MSAALITGHVEAELGAEDAEAANDSVHHCRNITPQVGELCRELGVDYGPEAPADWDQSFSWDEVPW